MHWFEQFWRLWTSRVCVITLGAALLGQLLMLGGTRSLPGAAAAPKTPAKPVVVGTDKITFLALGDSVTQGDKNHLTYRYWLQRNLRHAGYRVDFVGSRKDPRDGKLNKPPADFDMDHEGWWGLAPRQVLEKIEPIAALKPQNVVIYLGFDGFDPPEPAVADISRIVDALRKANPRVAIYLAQIIPVKGKEPKVAAFNQQIVGLGKSKQSLRSPLIIVDQSKGFDVARMSDGGGLPNEEGEKFVADRFFAAMAGVLSQESSIARRVLEGGLAKLNHYIRIGDYGGLDYEIDEMMAGGRLQGEDLAAAMELLNDLAAYASAQQSRVKYLLEQKRVYDAGPILDKLRRQFGGRDVGHKALDDLAALRRNDSSARELDAGPGMEAAHKLRMEQDYARAGAEYLKVASRHAGTQAAVEAKRLADEMEKRVLVRK